MVRLSLPIVMLVAATALTACDNESTVLTGADGSKVEISEDGQDTTITTSGANSSMTVNAEGGRTWPADAAPYAPPYPAAAVTASMSGNTGDGSGGMVTFITADSPDKIIEFYKSRAAAAGLSNVSNMDINGAKIFGASDEQSGRSLSIQANIVDGKTTAAVTFGTNKK